MNATQPSRPHTTHHFESNSGELYEMILIHVTVEEISMRRRFDGLARVGRAYATGIKR